VDECKPLPSMPSRTSLPLLPRVSLALTSFTSNQGLSLVHYSAQGKHNLRDTLGA
jgi:hypothetical protein